MKKSGGEALRKSLNYKAFLPLFSLTAAFCVFSSAAFAGGSCGSNCHWDLTNGVLTITGTGANGAGKMANYSSINSVPWYSQRASITSVNIADGITNIG